MYTLQEIWTCIENKYEPTNKSNNAHRTTL